MNRLLRIRRLYLQEIADSPGKRAAFEILTELAVDWEKARALEPQPDEPYNIGNQRQPDMVLTAESGWSFGELGYGPDRKAEMRKAVDEHRAKKGLEAGGVGIGVMMMKQRSFDLNSRESYEAVCEPRERPWIPNGALPREPRARDLPVIVERRLR